MTETKQLMQAMGPVTSVDHQAEVILKKRITLEHKPTGRSIEYTPLKEPLTTTACSSFVRIHNCVSSLPKFGYIDTLFQYKGHDFARVQEYTCAPLLCKRTGLWSIADNSKTSKIIVYVSKLSRPLVVARQKVELWMLDCY